jgi:YHS domain-containing protein
MKNLALTLAVAAFAAISLAGPAPKTIACCVMTKNKVDIAKATKNHMYADYKGNRYFFCCAGCPEAFKKDPAKFKNAPHIKTPKTK